MRLSRAIALTIAAVTSVASVVAAQPAPGSPPTGDGSAAPAESGSGSAAPDAAAEPAKPAKPEEEENLLAHIKDEPDADKAAKHETSSFGTQLRLFGLEVTWSGYGDIVFSIVPKDRKSATFDASQVNPIMTMRMTEHLSSEVEFEYEHGGEEIGVEYAVLDWQPTDSRALMVRLGKFIMPIGRFNEVLHPSFRWNQVTRPLMMNDVLPAVWSEVGAQVRGTVGTTTVLDYAAYAVNGLGGDLDPMDEEGIRNLRDNVEDNNFDKAFGGRLALTQRSSARQLVSLGVSGYSGKIDPAGSERLTIVDVDAQVVLGGLTLNAEAAQSYLGRRGSYTDPLKRGAYVQAAYAIGKLTLAGRWDYAQVGPVGGPLETHQQAAGTVRYSPAPSWSVRVEAAVPFVPEGAADDTTLLAMASFVF